MYSPHLPGSGPWILPEKRRPSYTPAAPPRPRYLWWLYNISTMEETKNEKEEDILSLMQTWKRSTQGQKKWCIIIIICCCCCYLQKWLIIHNYPSCRIKCIWVHLYSYWRTSGVFIFHFVLFVTGITFWRKLRLIRQCKYFQWQHFVPFFVLG